MTEQYARFRQVYQALEALIAEPVLNDVSYRGDENPESDSCV
jgi:hypothetical protein